MARQQVAPVIDEDEVQGSTESGEDPAGVMFENNQDGLVVDLQGVEEFKFEILPAGKYNVIVEDCNFAMSKSSGKPMWNIRLNVLDEEYQNRKVFTIFSFSEGALPGTKSALAVLNPELLESPFRVDDPETFTSVIGKYAKVRVAIQKQEGYDDRNQVRQWYQPEGSAAFA